jgi:hypothetical protein
VVVLTSFSTSAGRSYKPSVFILRWVRSPYDEINGPFESGCFPLTVYGHAERRAVDAIHASWLSKNPRASIQNNVLNEIWGDKAQYSGRQLVTTGKFDAEWRVTMSYRLRQGFSEANFGRMGFLNRRWQRLAKLGK